MIRKQAQSVRLFLSNVYSGNKEGAIYRDLYLMGENADIEVDDSEFEIAVGHVERGCVEGHVDPFGALVGGGTPSGVGNANWGCDVGSSGSGFEHFFIRWNWPG